MLMSHKQKVYHRPPPALEFDKFLRIRSEKQSIIQVPSMITLVIIIVHHIKSSRILGTTKTDQNRLHHLNPANAQKTPQ